MLATAFAPEILIVKNVADLQDAKDSCKEMEQFSSQDGVAWTKTHALFANMGGFVIVSHQKEGKSLLGQEVTYHLRAHDIYSLRAEWALPKLSEITAEQIWDKSKSDGFGERGHEREETWREDTETNLQKRRIEKLNTLERLSGSIRSPTK